MRLVLVLLMASLLLFSCDQNKEIDFHKAAWKPVDTAGYYEYITTNATNEQTVNKKVVLKIVGWLSNDGNKMDTSNNNPGELLSFLKPELSGYDFVKSLGENSTGYIKMNFKKYLLGNYRNENHFVIYFPRDYSLEALRKDSVILSNMKVFREINITTSEMAVQKYSEDNDTTWKQFLTGNPLPTSLDLKLTDSFLEEKKFDSVRALLENDFPDKKDIIVGSIREVLAGKFDQNSTLIFKFIVF